MTYAPSVEINLDHLLHNLRQIRSRLPRDTGIIAVVKDSAYGCGAKVISRTLATEGGVDCFAVARTEEALTLRRAGITGTLLVLGKPEAEEIDEGIAAGVVFTCNTPDDLHLWKESGKQLRFHCNIDTGMHRMGLLPGELPDLVDTLTATSRLRCEGLFTHMASADLPGTATVKSQYERFREAITLLKNSGIEPSCIHIANSATIFRHPLDGATHARPGIALYGCRPDPNQDFGITLEPVPALKGAVVSLRTVPAGSPVSYGGNHVTNHETTIATIGVGYAHGVPRYLSNRGSVLIGGKRYRIAGNVTMDYIMADIGNDTDCTPGDEAVIIGRQKNEVITPDDVAILGNTIGYEVLCNIGRALPRSYIREGVTVEHHSDHSF